MNEQIEVTSCTPTVHRLTWTGKDEDQTEQAIARAMDCQMPNTELFKAMVAQTRLSLLICSVPSRIQDLAKLLAEIDRQIAGRAGVEVIVLMDNRQMSVGRKRQELLRMARGEFITYIDDDDWIAPDYVEVLMEILDNPDRPPFYPDVICPEVRVSIDGEQHGIVEMSCEYAREGPLNEYRPPRTCRPPHELAIWSRAVALQSEFPNLSYGEDFDWARKLWPMVQTELKISKALYWWRHSTAEEIHKP